MKYPPHHAVEMLRQYPDGELQHNPPLTIYGDGVDPRLVTAARVVVGADGQRELFLEMRAVKVRRPSFFARRVALVMAHQAMTRIATPNLGQRDARCFAREQCLKLWPNWTAIQRRDKEQKVWGVRLDVLPGEDRRFREYRQETWAEIQGAVRCQFIYTGTREDMTDFTVVMHLAGSTWAASAADGVRIQGPAWTWCWGWHEATFSPSVRLWARGPGQ